MINLIMTINKKLARHVSLAIIIKARIIPAKSV